MSITNNKYLNLHILLVRYHGLRDMQSLSIVRIYPTIIQWIIDLTIINTQLIFEVFIFKFFMIIKEPSKMFCLIFGI